VSDQVPFDGFRQLFPALQQSLDPVFSEEALPGVERSLYLFHLPVLRHDDEPRARRQFTPDLCEVIGYG